VTDLRVLVIADNLLARAGLAALLASQQGCEVVGQISGALLVEETPLYRADVLVYDLGWEAAPALARLATLADTDSDVPVVALLQDENAAASAASTLRTEYNMPYGLLLRDREPSDIVAALNAVTHGLMVVDPALASNVFALASSPSPEPNTPQMMELTPREREVLQLLSQGLPNKSIALKLDISDHTVKFHVNAIMTKLGAQSRTEAVVRATRLGLIIL
jgi:two-component system nitrate/nitrite response regulator NarL